MKRITQNLLLAVFASLLIFSCGKDDEPTAAAPSVTVSATIEGTAVTSGSDVTAGSSIIVTVDITAPGGVNGLDVNGTSYSRTQLGAEAGDTQASITFNAQVLGSDLVGSSVIWEVEAVDDAGQVSATVTFTVNVTSPAVNAYSAVLLGAQGNANEGFYDALTNTRYTYANARDASGVNSSPIDLAYYYGNTNQNTIASIDDSGLHNVYNSVSLPIEGIFGTRNSTRFLSSSLSATEFADIATDADLETAASFEVSGSSSITQLVADQVIAMQLDADRGGAFGLIRVVSIDDTNGDGTITIEVKMPSSN